MIFPPTEDEWNTRRRPILIHQATRASTRLKVMAIRVDNSFNAEPFDSVEEESQFAAWVRETFTPKRTLHGVEIFHSEDSFVMLNQQNRVLSQMILKNVHLSSGSPPVPGNTTEISYAWTNKEFRKSSYVGELMRLLIRDLSARSNILSDGLQSDAGARAWIRSLIRTWHESNISPDGVLPGVLRVKISDSYRILEQQQLTLSDLKLDSELFSESGDENDRILLLTQR
jgi:hypothetical protein